MYEDYFVEEEDTEGVDWEFFKQFMNKKEIKNEK
jgi:hypothetical protein